MTKEILFVYYSAFDLPINGKLLICSYDFVEVSQLKTSDDCWSNGVLTVQYYQFPFRSVTEYRLLPMIGREPSI